MGTEEEGCLAWEPDCSFASLFRFAPYPWLLDWRTGVFRTTDKKGERKDYKGQGEQGACKQVDAMLKKVSNIFEFEFSFPPHCPHKVHGTSDVSRTFLTFEEWVRRES